MKNKPFLFASLLILASMWVTACEKEVEVTRVVTEKETVTVVEEKVETLTETVVETVVVKETVVETVVVTATPFPTPDVEAEKKILESAPKELYDAAARLDTGVINRYTYPHNAYVGNKDYRGLLAEPWNNGFLEGVKITVNHRTWTIAPELAVAKSEETWTFGRVARHFLITVVWKEKDGQWQAVHTHMSEYP
jgi:hypothetical protein